MAEVKRSFTIDDLTFDELEEFEERTGVNVADLDEKSAGRVIVLRTISFLMLRRKNALLTWEEMGGKSVNDIQDALPKARREPQDRKAKEHNGSSSSRNSRRTRK